MKRVLLSIALLVLSAGFLAAEDSIALDDFNQIEITHTFKVTLVPSDHCEIVFPSNLDWPEGVNVSDVYSVGNGTLRLAFQNAHRTNKSQKEPILIYFKSLESIHLSGASSVKTEQPIHTSRLDVEVSGASSAKLDVVADRVDAEVDGASRFTLSGTMKELAIDASGATGSTLSGTAEQLSIEASGVAQVDAEALTAKEANIDFSGTASAKLHVQSVSGKMSGASHLKLNPEAENTVSRSGAAAITTKGVTKSGKITIQYDNDFADGMADFGEEMAELGIELAEAMKEFKIEMAEFQREFAEETLGAEELAEHEQELEESMRELEEELSELEQELAEEQADLDLELLDLESELAEVDGDSATEHVDRKVELARRKAELAQHQAEAAREIANYRREIEANRRRTAAFAKPQVSNNHQPNPPHRHRRSRRDQYIHGFFDIGFNGYGTDPFQNTLPKGYEGMELLQNKSMVINLNVWNGGIRFGYSNFGIGSGLGIGWNIYRFLEESMIPSKDKTLGTFVIKPYAGEEEREFTKSKLQSSWLKVPLFLYYKDKNFAMSAGVVGNVRLGASAKQVYTHPETGKERRKSKSDFYLNGLRADAEVRVAYRNVGVFATYALTDMFVKNHGPENLMPYSFGVSLCMD